ncbi:50S ribosomal protein L6 [Mesomycoplasma lagogenitalium]|uniref:Large ribosomal subunit protein uL6 n=1 Tax=Mesomycoplasma lagogenitalium TaxID=171286 RepID=A0ABY8LWA2_9BACT|nr:50S ribosomal protein L6 [Mesomycoplasma lagogenitalium]WGI36573.1 50S ribosomal protein L6 [Mesomycoplasma lagogenitalium]
MSRVGKRVLTIPQGIEVIVNKTEVTVKGKLGTLVKNFSPLILIKIDGSSLTTERVNEEKHTKQLHGTTNSLIAGMIEGVTNGFVKELEIKGVGYKATLKDNQLEILAGFSHPVLVDIPSSLKVEVPKPVSVKVSGIDKQEVGQLASVIRAVRKPSPYSGKGIMYKGEMIRRKEGKKASK